MLSNTTARFEELKQQAVGSVLNAKPVNTEKVAIEVNLRHPTVTNDMKEMIVHCKNKTNLYC